MRCQNLKNSLTPTTEQQTHPSVKYLPTFCKTLQTRDIPTTYPHALLLATPGRVSLTFPMHLPFAWRLHQTVRSIDRHRRPLPVCLTWLHLSSLLIQATEKLLSPPPTLYCLTACSKLSVSHVSVPTEIGLRPLGCWNFGFESRWEHGCLSLVFTCCVVPCR
jgi:hypothetical protein